MASGASAQVQLKKAAARLAAAESERDLAVSKAMAAGCSWAEIGAALGVSAQAAHRRFRFLRHDEATGEVWREPPLGT